MANILNNQQRVICLIDMDCFYVQVEELAMPEFRGKPCGVSQYNPYRGGGLIAVNYEARKFGVKRGMRGEEAKILCPEFQIFYVNQKRGKADLTKYRDASLKIFEIILKHNSIVEKASIDEAYLDLTENVLNRMRNREQILKIEPSNLKDSHVVGSFVLNNENPEREINLNAWISAAISNDDFSLETSDQMLAVGALIVQEIREDIKNKLGYHCSAGIANNKTLAKFCCGLNKPSKQTILPLSSVENLLDKSPINKIKNLGGKLGELLNDELNLKFVGDLAKITLNDLIKRFGEKTGNWLHQISHGIDLEPVLSRQMAKSIGCSKNFRGKQALDSIKKVEYWVKNLCEELEERLESDKTLNQREASLLVVHVTNEAGTFSKSTNIKDFVSHQRKSFAEQILELISGFNKNSNKTLTNNWQPAIYTLGLSATKFQDLTKNENNSKSSILKYFTNQPTACLNANEPDLNTNQETSLNTSTTSKNDTHSSSLTDEFEKIAENLDQNKIEVKKTNDIKEMLLKQKNSMQSLANDDTDIDADDVFILDENQPTTSFAAQEDVDYVKCDTCKKKILCWEMPEHQDFHFAQMLSKEICGKETIDSFRNDQENKKKRSIEEVSTNNLEKANDKNSLFKNTKTNKKPKVSIEPTTSLKHGEKQIDTYFKKLNKS